MGTGVKVWLRSGVGGGGDVFGVEEHEVYYLR